MALNDIIKEWILPPAWLRGITGWRSRHYGFLGNYGTWEEACSQCQGYDAQPIFEKVCEATVAVRDGHCAYERDSVQFAQPDCNWPVLASLMTAAAADNKLRVLDFGGALGSLYSQHLPLLRQAPSLRWGVVEQPHFVDFGKRELATETLSFHTSIADCVEAIEPNVILLASVLQYLPEPESILEQLLSIGCRFLLHDRTTCATDDRRRLAVQRVHPSIYTASYPAWIFAESNLRRLLSVDHVEIAPPFPQPETDERQGVRYVGGFYQRRPAS